MQFKSFRAHLILALGLSSAANLAMANHESEALFNTPQAAHCACLSEVDNNFDFFQDFTNPHMPTTGAEEGLRRWVHVEHLYKSCMRRNGRTPAENPFPYGIDEYPGGSILNPAECSAS